MKATIKKVGELNVSYELYGKDISENRKDVWIVEFCGTTYCCKDYWHADDLKKSLEKVTYVAFE